jgi:hypothetical protein
LPEGTTVAFKTYAWAVAEGAHVLASTATASVRLKAPVVVRVSITRQGVTV